MCDTGINTTEPSFEKYRIKILKEIKQMQQDETMFFKAEFATRFQDRGLKFLPPHYHRLKNLFITRYCTAQWYGLRQAMDADYLFEMNVKDFKTWCDETVRQNGWDELEKQEKETGDAEKIFIRLVRLHNDFAHHNMRSEKQYADKLIWDAKTTACNILHVMHEHYSRCWVLGETVEEEFLMLLLLRSDGEAGVA